MDQPLPELKQEVEDNMKIGLSYSRCVLDIVEDRVSIDDVLVLITRTDFDPRDDDQWTGIWQGYTLGGMSNPEWANYDLNNKDHEDKFRSVSCMLYEDGKMHQPRQFGAHPKRRPEIWLEAVLPNSELENNPAAKLAWDKFQTIASLSSVELDDKYK
jgi:hypothetical protein